MTKRTSDKSSLIKVNTATVIAVLALHIGIAAALTHMQMPKQIVEKPEEIKPVEIQLLSLEETPEPMPKAELPKEIEQPTPVPQPIPATEQPTNSEAKPQTKPQNEPKPEPRPKPKPEDPKPQNKSESHAEPEPEPQLTKDTESQTKPVPESKVEPVIEPETVTTKDLTPIIDSNEHERLIDQMAREKAAQEKAAQEKAAQEKAAQEKAAQEKAAQEKAAQEKAAQEKAAQEKAAQEKAAANNTPKSFSESQARWKRKPKLELPQQVDRRARLGEIFSLTLEVIVDKQGNVTKVTVTKSSGNKIVDNATVTEVKRSKLHPFTEDNLPVVGKIILPVEYVKK
ncbi:energy transducer TonB [Psychrobacter sanguinis]|uniref:energy transducer TonB n=1 Tax=Psychrobacter sanguinis TaxID=861445 RepID=UPI00191A19ED|nr:energy transducer TonB [Psychrobacter sanguinis]MCC3344724.1 TonB family protein [Psychrobacter sanguinis]